MRTGHGYNRAYLSRIPATKVTTPKCPCGYHNQTPKHLLLYCKLYKAERKKMHQKIRPHPLTWKIAMYTSKGLKASLTFLEKTGIATRAWLRGSKDLECDGGWRHGEEANGREEEESGRREERAEQVEREAGRRLEMEERGGVG
jgi:hypothetical protein